MRRLVAVLCVLALVVMGLAAGGWYAKRRIAETASRDIVRQLNTPAGKAELQKVLANPQVQAELAKLQRMDTGGLHFDSSQQAVQYALSKLSPGETARLMQDYLHRDSLTEARKVQIEHEILSQFTPQEVAAIAQAVLGSGGLPDVQAAQ